MSIILVIATVVIAAIYWLQIGFSNIPISQPHDLSKKGTLTELKVKLRRNPLNPNQDFYSVGVAVPNSRNEEWIATCRAVHQRCELAAKFRVRITDDNSEILVLDEITKTSPRGFYGDEFWGLQLLKFRLKHGSYTVTIENLDDDPTLNNPDGRVFFEYGSK